MIEVCVYSLVVGNVSDKCNAMHVTEMAKSLSKKFNLKFFSIFCFADIVGVYYPN